MIDLSLVGMLCGMAGAALTTSLLSSRRAIGFGLWVVGDAAWVLWGVGNDALPLVFQFAVFLVLAVRGVQNNLATR